MRIILALFALIVFVPPTFAQPTFRKKKKINQLVEGRGLGLVFKTEDYNKASRFSDAVFTEATKRKLALRNTNFMVQAPPPGDQGMIGSCVAWAVGYAFLSSYLQRNTPGIITWNNTNMRSPGFVYHFAKVNNDCINSGCYMNVGLECIRDNGSCSWDLWPGNGDCNKRPLPTEEADACSVSSPWKWGKVPNCEPREPPDNRPPGPRGLAADGPVLWQRIEVTDVNTMKGALVQFKWPIIVGLNVTNSFRQMWWNGGYWIKNDVFSEGGHAVCIVGYDDTKTFNGKRGMFKCQNSWGAGFGDRGYFWVSYELVRQNCFREVYVWSRNEDVPLPCANCPM